MIHLFKAVSSYSPLYPFLFYKTPEKPREGGSRLPFVSDSLSCLHSLEGGKEQPSSRDEESNVKCFLKQTTIFNKSNTTIKFNESTLTVSTAPAFLLFNYHSSSMVSLFLAM
jgi:hypothetical protein